MKGTSLTGVTISYRLEVHLNSTVMADIFNTSTFEKLASVLHLSLMSMPQAIIPDVKKW